MGARVREAIAWVLAVWMSVASVGCGGSDRPPMVRVTGKVTHNGQPLAKAQISFVPEDTKQRPALGVTDDRGEYQLTTYDAGDGAVVGKHKVAVTARKPFAGKVPEGMGAAYLEEQEQKGEPLIPTKYFNPETSGLTADVSRSQTKFDFDLQGGPEKVK